LSDVRAAELGQALVWEYIDDAVHEPVEYVPDVIRYAELGEGNSDGGRLELRRVHSLVLLLHHLGYARVHLLPMLMIRMLVERLLGEEEVRSVHFLPPVGEAAY